MAHVMMELTQDDRPVVLLTLREAQAVWAEVKDLLASPDTDLGRAKHVLENQIHWLRSKGY